MVREQIEKGELYLLRYEDLTKDFAGTFSALLSWLGLDSSHNVIEKINSLTSFETRTGRSKGQEKKGVIRKGAILEWRDALNSAQQTQAWDIAGEQLEYFGYTNNGEFLEFRP